MSQQRFAAPPRAPRGAGRGGAASASKGDGSEWAWDARHAGANVLLGTSVILNDDNGVAFAKGVVEDQPRTDSDKTANVKVLALRCPQTNWEDTATTYTRKEKSDLMPLQELFNSVTNGLKEEPLFKDTDDKDFISQAQVMLQDNGKSGPRYLGGVSMGMQEANGQAERVTPLAFDPYKVVQSYTEGNRPDYNKPEGEKSEYSVAVFVDQDQSSRYGSEQPSGAMHWAKRLVHEDSAFDLTTLEGGIMLANYMRTRIAARHNRLMDAEQQKFIELTQGAPNKMRVRIKDSVVPVRDPGYKLSIWKQGNAGPAGARAAGGELEVGMMVELKLDQSESNGPASWVQAKIASGSAAAGEYEVRYEVEDGIFAERPKTGNDHNDVLMSTKVIVQKGSGGGRGSVYDVVFATDNAGLAGGGGAKNFGKAKGGLKLQDGELSYDLDRPDLHPGCFPHEGCFLDVVVTDKAAGGGSRGWRRSSSSGAVVGRNRIPLAQCDKLRVTVNRADLRSNRQYADSADPCVRIRVYRRVEDKNGQSSLLLLDEQRSTSFDLQGHDQPTWEETVEFTIPSYDATQLRQIPTVHEGSRDGLLLQDRTAGKLAPLYIECEVCQGDEGDEQLTTIGMVQVPISDTSFVSPDTINSGDAKFGPSAGGEDLNSADAVLFPEARVSFDGTDGRRYGTILRNYGPTCRLRVEPLEGAGADEYEMEEVLTVHSDKLRFEGGSVMNHVRGGRRSVEMKCALEGGTTGRGAGVYRGNNVASVLGGQSANGSITLTFEYAEGDGLVSSAFGASGGASGNVYDYDDGADGEEGAAGAFARSTEIFSNTTDNQLWDVDDKPGRQHVSKVGGDPGAIKVRNGSVNVEWVHYHEVLGLPPFAGLASRFRRRRACDVPATVCVVGGNAPKSYTLSDVLSFSSADSRLRIEAIDPPSATGSGDAGQTNVWLTGNHMALFELVRTSTSQGEGGRRKMKPFNIMETLSSTLEVTVINATNLRNTDGSVLENPCGVTVGEGMTVIADVSDPYVEVSLTKGKDAATGQLAEVGKQRTPTIMNSLNPRWSKCLHVQLEPEVVSQPNGNNCYLGIQGFSAQGVQVEAEVLQGTGNREKVIAGSGYSSGTRQKLLPREGGSQSRYAKFLRVEPRIDKLRLTFSRKRGNERFASAEVDLSDRRIFPLNDRGVSTKGLTSGGLTRITADIMDLRGKLGEITVNVGFEQEGDRMSFDLPPDFGNNASDYRVQITVKDKDGNSGVALKSDDVVGRVQGGISLAAVDPEGVRALCRDFRLVASTGGVLGGEELETDSFVRASLKWAKGRGSAIEKGSNCVFELPYALNKITVVDAVTADGDSIVATGVEAANRRSGFRKDLAMSVGGQQTIRATTPLRSAGSEAKDATASNAVQATYAPGDIVEVNYASVGGPSVYNRVAHADADIKGKWFRAKVVADGTEPNGLYPSVGIEMLRPAKDGRSAPSAAFDAKQEYKVGDPVVVNYRNRTPPRWVSARVRTVCDGLAGAVVLVPGSPAASGLKARIEEHGGVVVSGAPTNNTRFIVHPECFREQPGSLGPALKSSRYVTVDKKSCRLGGQESAVQVEEAVLNRLLKLSNDPLRSQRSPPMSGLYDLTLNDRPNVADARAGGYRVVYLPSPNPADRLDALDKPEQVAAAMSQKSRDKQTRLYQRVSRFMSEHADPAWRKSTSWIPVFEGAKGAAEKAPPRNNKSVQGNCATLDEWLEQYDANDYDVDRINQSLIGHLQANATQLMDTNRKSGNAKWSTGWKCISGMKGVKTNSIDVHIKKAWNLRRTDSMGAEGTDPYVRLSLVAVTDINSGLAGGAGGDTPAAKQLVQEIESGVTLKVLLGGSNSRRPGLRVQRLSEPKVYRTRHIRGAKNPDWTRQSGEDYESIITMQLPPEKDYKREELCLVVELWDYDNPRTKMGVSETDTHSATTVVPLDPRLFGENRNNDLDGPATADGFRCVKVDSRTSHGEAVSIASPLRRGEGAGGWVPEALASPQWHAMTNPGRPQDFGLELQQPKEARQTGAKGNVGGDKRFKSCLQLSIADNSLFPDTSQADGAVQKSVVLWYKRFFPNDPNFQSEESIRTWLRKDFKNVTRAKIRLQEIRVNEALRKNYRIDAQEAFSGADGSKSVAGADLLSERPLEAWVEEGVNIQAMRNASGGNSHVFEVELNWSLLGCGIGVVGERFGRYNGYMCDDPDGYCLWWDGSAFARTQQTLEFMRDPKTDVPHSSADEDGGGDSLRLSTISPGDRVRMDVDMQELTVTFYKQDAGHLVKLAKIGGIPKVVYPAVSFCDGTTCSTAKLLKKHG